jgi:hypothetical protein
MTQILRRDDGAEVTVPVPINTGDNRWQVVAALVPTAAGYDAFPSTTASDGSFVIPGVPQGLYYLEVEIPAPGDFGAVPFTSVEAAFYSFTADTPDLSTIYSERADVAFPAQTTTLTFLVDGLVPWNPGPPPVFFNAAGDSLIMLGSQAQVLLGVANPNSLPTGATSVSKQLNWFLTGLPDASKGDVEFIFQKSSSVAGSGATSGSVRAASRFARIADLTLADGASATRTLTLTDAPQTGSLNGRILGSQWAPLIQQSNPTAQVTAGGQRYTVFGTPGPTSFPDMGGFGAELATVLSPVLTDVDYGTIAYGQFLGSPWHELRDFVLYANYQVPGGSTFALPMYESVEATPTTGALAPVLGPPLSPKIQGLDAFQPQSGVGLTPVISWSPPSLGAPTSYQVSVSPTVSGPFYTSLTFTVYGQTSLRIPPGFLASGVSYQLSVSSFQAPWDTLGRPPMRTGAPWASAQTLSSATFTP